MPKIMKELPFKATRGDINPDNDAARKMADAHPGKWVQVDLNGRKAANSRFGFSLAGYEVSIRKGELYVRKPA